MIRVKRDSFAWRTSMWALIALLAAVCIGSVLTTVLSCSPVSRYWDIESRLSGNAGCWPIIANVDFSYGFGAFFVVTDFIMAMLP
jgi:hypothetical protein